MTGVLRCLGNDLRDWHAGDALGFFHGALTALEWVLEMNRSGVCGTYLAVELIVYVESDTPPLSLGVLHLENATHEQLADHVERLVGALFRACGIC